MNSIRPDSRYPESSEALTGIHLFDEQPPRSEIVEDFLKKYATEKDQRQWIMLKEKAIDICKRRLKERELLAHVTGRVKEIQSARKQLYRDLPKKAILEERRDFVGCRVATYFPSDQAEVTKIIQEAFQEDEQYRRPKGNWQDISDIHAYRKRFGSYDEDHYWVRLRPDDRKNAGEYGGVLFEVQLRSVIMDSWDTIAHNLEYKGLTGVLSKEELRILDSIKGLASTGEVLLEHLEEVHRSRVESDKRYIWNANELGVLLENYFQDIETTPLTQYYGRSHFALFSFLEIVGLTKIGDLREILRKLDIRKKLQEEYHKWALDTHPFPATQPDFILYALLRRIPDQSLGHTLEKAVHLKVENWSRWETESIEVETSIDRLIYSILKSILRYIRAQQIELRGVLLTDQRKDSCEQDLGLVFKHAHTFTESSIAKFAVAWYGSIGGLPNAKGRAGVYLVSAVLKASPTLGFSPSEFGIQQQFFCLERLEPARDKIIIQLPDSELSSPNSTNRNPNMLEGEDLLDDLVKRDASAWNDGFECLNQIVRNVSSQIELQQGAALAVLKDEEVRWLSLESAALRWFPSLVKLEIEKLRTTCPLKALEPDLRELIQLSITEHLFYCFVVPCYKVDEDKRLAEVVRTLLEQIEPTVDSHPELETSLHVLSRANYVLTARVMFKEWRKWKKEPFAGNLDEILEEYRKKTFPTQVILQQTSVRRGYQQQVERREDYYIVDRPKVHCHRVPAGLKPFKN